MNITFINKNDGFTFNAIGDLKQRINYLEVIKKKLNLISKLLENYSVQAATKCKNPKSLGSQKIHADYKFHGQLVRFCNNW
jgi:hypothetical protein